jgi:predicted AAA+ superfamily ATPase
MTDSPFWLDFDECRATLLKRLEELPPTRIQLLTGPRQVGKTTLLLDLANRLGEAAHYVAVDDPNAGLPGFWERIWSTAESRASTGSAVVLIDEIQHFADWAGRIKGQYDRLKRRKIPIHIVATGSSALLLGAGSRESLAGRFERLILSHWSVSALSRQFTLSPSDAALFHVRFGSYPGSLQLRDDLSRWRAYVRDSIIEPAIGRDVLALGAVRRPALLRQVFAVAAGAPAQIVSLQKLQGQLQDRGSLETIAHYLNLLEQAYLVAALQKYGDREHRRRAAPPKLVILNNALLSAMHPQGAPDQSLEPGRFGLWVENACLAFACNRGQRVAYWREEPLEVDGIISGSWGEWAIEIKTGGFDNKDLRGLLEFCRRYPRHRPLVVTSLGQEHQAERLGIASISWPDFLLLGPPV